MIVDDEQLILNEVAEALEGEGYECYVSTTVSSALTIISKNLDIALILTDQKMKDYQGTDLIAATKLMSIDAKYIVMSGHANPNLKDTSIDLSDYVFLQKPVKIEKMLEAVCSVLTSKEKKL